MKTRILNFLIVNTSWCTKRVIDWIQEAGSTQNPSNPKAIFLDLPRDFEPYLKDEKLLRILEDRLDSGFKQHVSSLKPLFEFAFAENVPIYCYKDNLHSITESSISFDLLILVLKARLGNIDLNRWRDTISTDLKESKKFAEYEANFIAERAKDPSVCLNLNEEMEKVLIELGFEVERIELYSFNRPIDRIYSLIREELIDNKPRDSELKDLIREHVKFIDDVIERGFEEACRFW